MHGTKVVKGRGLLVVDGDYEVKVCPVGWQDTTSWRRCGPACAWWDEDGKCCKVVLALDRVEDGLPLIAESIGAVACKLDAVVWAIAELALKMGVTLGK
jgi:hypothetical protein